MVIDFLSDLLVYDWRLLLFLIFTFFDESAGEDYRCSQTEENAHFRKTSHHKVLEVID